MNRPFNRTEDRHLYGGRDVMKHIYMVLDFFYFILGWFTITVEVFLRRDFGERYLNKLTFTIGFLILTIWTMGAYGLSSFAGGLGASSEQQGGSTIILLYWLGFVLLSSIHFVSIWWRNRTNRPLHSLDPGKSWLLPLGKLLVGVVNVVSWIPIQLFALGLSAEDKQVLNKLLPLVPDSRTFTERFLEPIIVWLAGIILMTSGAGAVGLWLMFVGLALVVHAGYRYETERYQFLHLRDQILEAKYLPDAIKGMSDVIRIPQSIRETVIQTAERMRTDAPEMMEEIQQNHPSLAEAMAAVNANFQNSSEKNG